MNDDCREETFYNFGVKLRLIAFYSVNE